jgi:hypothetical protein
MLPGLYSALLRSQDIEVQIYLALKSHFCSSVERFLSTANPSLGNLSCVDNSGLDVNARPGRLTFVHNIGFLDR